jgi:DNA repair exonuclease SbcCD ATPase subunit
MLDFNTENAELDNFSEGEEFDESYIEDEELNDSWVDTANRDAEIEVAAIEFINELTAIRTSLTDRQQLTDSFDRLNYNVAEQHQQLQTIIRSLEQLAKSLSTENISKLLQIQKSFSTFAQKLEMFEKAINSNIRQQQESRTRGDEIYQNLDRAWRRLADEIKEQRQIIGGIASWESFAILSIGTGFSAAAFMFVGFKFFLIK